MFTNEEILQRIKNFSSLSSLLGEMGALQELCGAVAEYANQDKWISVEDELPENEVSVLVFIEGQIEIDSYDKDGWMDHYYDVRTITHWQKLPNPPKQ